jgi:iron complex outermembrane receptor protein
MSHVQAVASRHPCGATPTLLALLSWALCEVASAQTASAPQASLPTVTVTAPNERPAQATITGFANTPAWQLPMQAQTYSASTLKNNSVQHLADLVSLDASISDAYNAAGYWDNLSVRGFGLDGVYNYRREGLPINAETSIPLDNKEAVEVLKGTSGMQAGISAPGGLVNLLVKRPQSRVRSATLAFTGGSSALASVDLSDRFGVGQAIGLRVNASYEQLNPSIHDQQGHRQLLAVATDLRVSPDTLLEFEIEHSNRSQPSVPGFSLLGDRLPSAHDIDPNTNLNAQPWTQPVELEGTTGTLRWTQQLGQGWQMQSTLGTQRLLSQDRVAFAYGCPTGAGDRYCSDGTFLVWDYRSPNEIRVTHALNVTLTGQAHTGPVIHDLQVGLLRSVRHTDLDYSAFNPVGLGNISGDFGPLPADPSLTNQQTDRSARSTELFISDALTLSKAWHAYVGLRHSQLKRLSSYNDGSLPEVTDQTFDTPWAALSFAFADKRQVYASWGEGVESKNSPFFGPTGYTNPGRNLPALKSRQTELGVKGQETGWQWSVNAFRITQPQASYLLNPDDGTVTYAMDGDARHQGLEGQVQTQLGAWSLDASAMVLDAERRHSANSGINGKQPVNVPNHTVKLSSDYRVPDITGLVLHGSIVHEGSRMVLEDNSISIPEWTRLDAGLRFTHNLGQSALTWRLGVYNLLDQRAWREAPYLFSHVYLFPMAGRTVTASLQAEF